MPKENRPVKEKKDAVFAINKNGKRCCPKCGELMYDGPMGLYCMRFKCGRGNPRRLA